MKTRPSLRLIINIGRRDLSRLVYIMRTKTAKEKKWILRECNDEKSKNKISKIAKSLNIHPIIAKILYNRGYKDESSVKNFIAMESEML